jgi:hypothetical protein
MCDTMWIADERRIVNATASHINELFWYVMDILNECMPEGVSKEQGGSFACVCVCKHCRFLAITEN